MASTVPSTVGIAADADYLAGKSFDRALGGCVVAVRQGAPVRTGLVSESQATGE
jgi:hypothetical protein